jgi:catechol 2,3-dioxygenase-like lactoylglutathione lyase family enzyme
MTDSAGPTGVGQIHISVADLAASIRFYRDQLGIPFLFEVPGQPMAFLQCGGTRLYLGVPEREEFRSRPVLYLTVDDIHASREAMASRGVTFVDEPHVVHATDESELWMAFTCDPDGNHVALMCDVRR